MKRQTSCDNHNVLATFDDSLLIVFKKTDYCSSKKSPVVHPQSAKYRA